MTYELERLAKIQAAAADDRDSIIVGDDVDLYQTEALRFAFYPRVDGGAPVYPALAMLGEIGELAGKIGPRDGGIIAADVLLELGDVLWYVAAFAQDTGWKMSEVTGASRWDDVPDLNLHLGLNQLVLRLVSLAGELSERYAKKPWRDGSEIDRYEARRGLRQIVLCLQAISDWVSCPGLDEVAQMNINKLVSRRRRGKLTGSGDNR